jgi:hypothetical protein
MIKALSHQEPDRVPTGEIGIDFPIASRVLGRTAYYRNHWWEVKLVWEGRRDELVANYQKDLVELFTKLELDFIPVFRVPAKSSSYKKPKKPELLDEYTWRDERGNIFQYSPSSGEIGCVKYAPLKINDLEKERVEEIDDSCLELVKYVIKTKGKTHFILGRNLKSFHHYGGFESFLMRMISEPEFVKKAMEIGTANSILWGKKLIDEGVDGVLIGGDFCSSEGPLMSPHHFRQYILPYLKEQCQELHNYKKDIFIIHHCDGNTWSLLDMFIEAGIDGIQAIQATAGMDIKRLKEKYGDELTFFGAIDGALLVKGTEDDIAREVIYNLKYGAPGGGFVLTSGNTIQIGVKFENYMKMLSVLKEYGNYPIKL